MPGRQGAEIAHDQHQKAHGEEGDAAVQSLLIRHVQKDQLDQRERQQRQTGKPEAAVFVQVGGQPTQIGRASCRERV